MSFFEDIFSNLKNTSNPFVFEASNVDSLFKFLNTIDWSERWLIGLIVFHLTTTTLILLTSRTSNFQIVLFFILLTLCYASERLNELGSRYWRYFSMEQYFDSDGIFIGVVFSGPIILNSCLLLLLWLYESYLMIINVVKLKKKAHLRSEEKRKEAAAKQASPAKEENKKDK